MFIPSLVLKQLYTRGSLKNTDKGVLFSLKNRLKDASIHEFKSVKIGDLSVDLSKIKVDTGDNSLVSAVEVSKNNSINFPLKKVVGIYAQIDPLHEGKHEIEITVETSPFGKLKLKVEDGLSHKRDQEIKIPRDEKDDYSEESIKTRQKFVEEFAKTELKHVPHYSFDPHILQGNIEHFAGVAQIPLGFAGPMKIDGEHAKGEFIIPMATTEGTLVASYNRGIKAINMSGGVKCTISGDAMQRAPVFVFEDARGARDFVTWVDENFKKIAEEAESTTSIGKLTYIDPFLSNKFAYLRFNYTTGDAAGQNMVGRATFAACSWIIDHYKGQKITNFYLESNLATDKKASQVNVMRTRGKRVIAEATLKREVLTGFMRVEPEQLAYHNQIANVGTILSGANNNGAHSANGITAMFIATGQDVANVSESSAGIFYSEVTKEGDLYISITIPSLIVATYGGGTSLATQRECLELLGCYGKGTVHKFAEIVAGVVLAGELSLGSAISSSDWVSSHEEYGRNR
ncbi:MAG: hydroxymethylglutaryl-CoA reductase [Bacteroidota bacterium]